ncbi:MAG: ShlB/FhaC/HecB family hemolysin secretion/activation protein, partial [Gammaproteobacteria bacterium]
LSPEEFSYGGEPFGRGYDPSELVGDAGGALQLELRYQGPHVRDWIPDYQVYGFYDAGEVWRRDPAIGEKANESAMSAGVGLRLALGYGITGYVEFAQPLTRDVSEQGDDGGRFFGGIAATY